MAYTAIPSSLERDSSELDRNEEDSFLSRTTRGFKPKKSNHKLLIAVTVCNLILFGASLAFFFFGDLRTLSKRNPLLRQASFYSPIFDMIDLELHTEKVNGSLFPTDDPSIARQGPTPEADAFWNEWELTRTIPITAEQVRALGKDPETVAKFEDNYWHLGDDAYMAQIDVFHQLHCLSSLRKLAYDDYYSYNKFFEKYPPQMRNIHVNHCVDILTQMLRCSGNVNLITMQWMDLQPSPFPDFSINRKCVNFEKLVDFRKRNSVDINMWMNMVKPNGINEVPAPPEYYELFVEGNWQKNDADEQGSEE